MRPVGVASGRGIFLSVRVRPDRLRVLLSILMGGAPSMAALRRALWLLLLLPVAARGAAADAPPPPVWLDHDDEVVPGGPVVDACNAAVGVLRESAEPPPPVVERVDFRGAARAEGERVVFAYFVLVSRAFADLSVSRLLYAAWAPRHLWLVHADLKTPEAAVTRLSEAVRPYGNVHLMRTRRRVSWGGFSMVEALFDALATAVHGVSGPDWSGFDYFINLSDTDLLLRVDAELDAFFGAHAARGASFVGVKTRASDPMRWDLHEELRKLTFVECAGVGYAVVNGSAERLFPNHRRCCYGRSGPILFGPLDFALPRHDESVAVYHGSQWVALHASLAAALLTDPAARLAVRGFRHTFLSDEAVVQTAVMAAPQLRRRVVNHNLRHIDWPHGYGNPEQYWRQAGEAHDGGPVMLTFAHAAELFGSEALSARKADPSVDGGRLYSLWDGWMRAKKEARGAVQGYELRPFVVDAASGQPTAERAPPVRVSQRPLGASLLERARGGPLEDALPLPHAPVDAAALGAAGLTEAEVRAALGAREAFLQTHVPHYGHGDNVTQYYLDFFAEVQRREAEARTAHQLAMGVAPPHTRAADGAQLGPPERLALGAEPGGGVARGRHAAAPLASAVFADGSACECDSKRCRARRTCCAHVHGRAGERLCRAEGELGDGAAKHAHPADAADG